MNGLPTHEKFTSKFTELLQTNVRACLLGGGGPQVGEVTRFGG